MLFNSIEFLIYFPIVILIYFIIPKKVKYIWLLVASYYFYMSWNPKYAILIAISTLVTYFAGILIEQVPEKATKKAVLAFGVVINLLILFFFKYLNFTVNTINSVLAVFHISAVEQPFSFLLPVGISFYTFQALGYAIDVYRGDVKAERNILKYALFVSFFPQLVAGPIERSKNLQSQIQKLSTEKLYSFEGVISGFVTMLWGLFMKMVISDRASIFVDCVFENLYGIGTFESIAALIAFAIQIYCDFAGYSAVAIGAAKVMGFDLMENFDTPFLANSVADHWRRWHISLSLWFKDYVYIPLGGSRKGKLRKYLNIMITFVLSGLWHGAAWKYVAWGAIEGFYQVVGDILRPLRKKTLDAFKVKTDNFSYTFGQIVITFILTLISYVFFRSDSVGKAFEMFKRIITGWNPWVLFNEELFSYGLDRREVGILAISVLVLIVVDLIKYFKNQTIGVFLLNQNMWFRWTVMILLAVAILVYGEYGINFDSNQFIYFAF